MRSIIIFLIVAFLGDVAAAPLFVHHSEIILAESACEAFAGFEETVAHGRFRSDHPLHCDGLQPFYIHTYQDPALETLKQPPRVSV